MKKALSLTLVAICAILLLSSFDIKKEDLLGFWVYCLSEDCSETEESMSAFLVFEEDSCHHFIRWSEGLDLQLLGSTGYSLKSDSIWFYEGNKQFVEYIEFLNDSTFFTISDSSERQFYRKLSSKSGF